MEHGTAYIEMGTDQPARGLTFTYARNFPNTMTSANPQRLQHRPGGARTVVLAN